MPLLTEDTYLVKDPVQRKALTSPLRLEILEHFVHGPLSVADLAERMDRRPDSLYYHIRKLVSVGLLLTAGAKKRGQRDETLYTLVSTSVAMPTSPKAPETIDSAIKTIAAGFRLTEREMRNALEQGLIKESSDEPNFWAARQRCRLRPGALRSINKHFYSVIKVIAREIERPVRSGDDSVACSITIAIVPVADRKTN